MDGNPETGILGLLACHANRLGADHSCYWNTTTAWSERMGLARYASYDLFPLAAANPIHSGSISRDHGPNDGEAF